MSLALLCALSCFLQPDPTAPAPRGTIAAAECRALPGDEKVLKALEAWLKAYRGGKLAFESNEDVTKSGIAAKFGVVPKDALGTITVRRELELMLEQAAALDSAPAVEMVLTVAAVGLDHGSVKYKPEMAPFAVRTIGERWLAKFKSKAAADHVLAIARGDEKVDKTWGAGVRAAAIRALGSRRDDDARALCEQQLTAPELPIRLAAAEALGHVADERSGEALARALGAEQSDIAVGAMVDAMRICFGPYLLRPVDPSQLEEKTDKDKKNAKDKDGKEAPTGGDKPAPAPPTPPSPPADAQPTDQPAAQPGAQPAAPPTEKPAAPAVAQPTPTAEPTPKPPTPAVLAAARAVIDALGRTNWRGDMQLLQFLTEFRTVEAAPALIAILKRFRDHPEQIETGVLSGLLLHRAHELLTSLTGATIPADAPGKWEEFWSQEKDKLLASKQQMLPRTKTDRTVVAFCGIPVEGNRVLFILDLSASMEWTMRPRPGATTSNPDEPIGISRLEFAKRQLHQAIAALPEITKVNLITFNGRPEANKWEKDLVDAKPKNKDRLLAYIDDKEKVKATYDRAHERDGGTNLWAGLEAALKMKALVYGDRDDQTVDEIFVLSDGAPSAGEVTDPIEILTVVAETNRFAKIRINTVFITSPNDRDPRQLSLQPSVFMRRLAEQNGGHFVEFNN